MGKRGNMKIEIKEPKKFLKAAEVNGHIKEIIIEAVSEIEFDSGKKIVIEGSDAKYVPNKTNIKKLVKMFGDDTDIWIGKTINIGTVKVYFAGNEVPSLTVL